LRGLLANDRNPARADNPHRPHRGWTGLHEAAHRGPVEAVRLHAAGAKPPAAEPVADFKQAYNLFFLQP
jgi:hypothetical protein